MSLVSGLYHARAVEISGPLTAGWWEPAMRKSARWWIYIDITAALRAVLNIARACACNILYLHEGASPRRRYFRIARRAQRARVLYDCSALEARMISCISMSGRFSSVVVMPLIRWSFTKFYKCKYIHNVIYPQAGVYHEASVSNNHSKLM